MSDCPKKGEVSDLCPRGICQGYGKESIAGGSRLLDLCTLQGDEIRNHYCDATKRDWDGPYAPYCWRFQGAALADLKTVAEGLAEALCELTDIVQGIIDGECRPDSFTLQPARDALAAWKEAQP